MPSKTKKHYLRLPAALNRHVMSSVLHEEFAINVHTENFEITPHRIRAAENVFTFFAGVETDPVSSTPLYAAQPGFHQCFLTRRYSQHP